MSHASCYLAPYEVLSHTESGLALLDTRTWQGGFCTSRGQLLLWSFGALTLGKASSPVKTPTNKSKSAMPWSSPGWPEGDEERGWCLDSAQVLWPTPLRWRTWNQEAIVAIQPGVVSPSNTWVTLGGHPSQICAAVPIPPTEPWEMIDCCIEPLSFGGICHTATGNKNNWVYLAFIVFPTEPKKKKPLNEEDDLNGSLLAGCLLHAKTWVRHWGKPCGRQHRSAVG